jgi:hypothetical protein
MDTQTEQTKPFEAAMLGVKFEMTHEGIPMAKDCLVTDMNNHAAEIASSPIPTLPDFQPYYEAAQLAFGTKSDNPDKLLKHENAAKGYAILAFVKEQRKQGKAVPRDAFTVKMDAIREKNDPHFRSPEAIIAYIEFKTAVKTFNPRLKSSVKRLDQTYSVAMRYAKNIFQELELLGNYILCTILILANRIRSRKRGIPEYDYESQTEKPNDLLIGKPMGIREVLAERKTRKKNLFRPFPYQKAKKFK